MTTEDMWDTYSMTGVTKAMNEFSSLLLYVQVHCQPQLKFGHLAAMKNNAPF